MDLDAAQPILTLPPPCTGFLIGFGSKILGLHHRRGTPVFRGRGDLLLRRSSLRVLAPVNHQQLLRNRNPVCRFLIRPRHRWSGRDSGPCTPLGESINCWFSAALTRFPGNLTSREFMARKPASTVCWSEVPPKRELPRSNHTSHRPWPDSKGLLTVFDLPRCMRHFGLNSLIENF